MSVFDRYVFLLDKDGINRCGSDWTYLTDLRQDAALVRFAQRRLAMNPEAKSAWLVPVYTQQMSEMSPKKLGEHIRKVGWRIA